MKQVKKSSLEKFDTVRKFFANTALGSLALFYSAALADDWSLSFESSEGFFEGALPDGQGVSLLGGYAEVLVGDAAEGSQYITFAPLYKENGIILNFSSEVSGGRERLLGFSFRLIDDPETTRLVLSYGQTIGLRPSLGGYLLELGDNETRFIATSGSVEWTQVEIRESALESSWSLWVSGRLVASDLPLKPSQASSDVLVFADGTLDLDAVYVLADDSLRVLESSETQSVELETLTEESSNGDEISELLFGKSESELFGEARKAGFEGEIAKLVDIAKLMVDSEEGSAEWHFDVGQILSIVGYALRGEGRARKAAIVASEALHYVDQARILQGNGGDDSLRATYEFVSGQLWEEIIGDSGEAERRFQNAVAIEETHYRALKSIERIARKRSGSESSEFDRTGGAL